MAHRLDLCKKKGFDGVDPDTWVAKAAHVRGLTAAQKGDNGQVKDLVKIFDFAVVEQCFVQGWCSQFDVYTAANRLVVDVEYYSNVQRFQTKNCPEAAKHHDTAILKKLQLTAWIRTCNS